MSKKRKSRESAAVIEQQKRKTRKIIIAVAIVIAVIAIIAVVSSFQNEAQYTVSVNADGNVVIPMTDVHEEFHHFDYGGPQQLLVWKEQEGVYHTAFNTCEECYSTGRASYEFQNGTLTCQACGNSMAVTGMGNDAWGGCQPVAIPEEYRADTDSEIVIPAAVLQYSENMFETWDSGDFSVTLEEYVS